MAMMTETRTMGISARRFIGRDIIGVDGEKVGEVDDLILHSESGCALYAIVDEGGFLGMGARHHVVPWKAISWSPDTHQLMVQFDRDRLTRAPVLDRNNMPEWTDESYGRQVYDYYGLTYQPYGTSSGMTGTTTGGSGTMSGPGMGI